MKSSYINITLILLFFQISVSAQLYKKIDIITTDDGLSQNVINTIFQDSKGFIWFGTNDGLNRYDGYEFKIYKNDFFDENSLTDNIVTSILEDNSNNLWIGTGSGLSKLNLLKNKFEQETLPEKLINTLSDKFITSLEQDLNNDLWIGTRSGLYILSTKTNEFIDFTKSDLPISELASKNITSLKKDPDGKIWVGIYGEQIYSFDPINDKLQKIVFSPDKNLYYVTSILNVSSEQMLVGTDISDFHLINLSGNSAEPFSTKLDYHNEYLSNLNSLSSNSFFFISYETVCILDLDSREITKLFNIKFESGLISHLIDKSGVLWAGTNGAGIYKILLESTNFSTVKKKNKIFPGLSFNSVRTMFVDNKNKLWVGGHHTIDTCSYQPGNFQNWGEIKEFNNLNVYSIIQDPVDDNIYWIGTELNGLIKYNTSKPRSIIYMKDEKKFLKYFNEVYKLLISSSKIIYIGTNKGLIIYKPFNGEFISFIDSTENQEISVLSSIKALYEDSNGLIWIGSSDEGVAVLDPKSNNIQKYKANSIEYPFCGNRINTFCEGANGVMWIGTENALNKYEPAKDSVSIYSLNESLLNNYIYGILADKNGNLWFSTNGGLYKFNTVTEEFTNFDIGHGLQSNEFNTVAFYKSNEGEMFFGGVKGFSSFFPENIKLSSYQPEVVFTKFRKSNKEFDLHKSITYLDTLELNYNDYFFSFDFASTDFANPEKIQFRYMLEGFHDEWIYTDKLNNNVGFTNIDPGEYNLRVAATNRDGILSPKETSLTIIIEPAFWETIWFKATSLFLIVFLIYLIINSRFRKLKQEKAKQLKLHERIISIQEEERKNISSELHDDLGQNLLVVKNKLLIAERDAKFEQIYESMDILDDTIQDISNISHSLHPTELDELGLSRAIEAMASRLSLSAEIVINVNLDSIDQFFIKEENINLFRIFQEALNNVIKHSQATKVDLNEIRTNNKLKVVIQDNGIGFKVNEQQGKDDRPRFGISGMKERVNILKGKFKIKSQSGKGTEIILEFIK